MLANIIFSESLVGRGWLSFEFLFQAQDFFITQ